MEAVFEVHSQLGPGFIEDVYEEALTHELTLRGIRTAEKGRLPSTRRVTVSYKGKVVGKHRLDIVVEDKILLELKAVSQLTDVFKQQVLSYLKATLRRSRALLFAGLKLGRLPSIRRGFSSILLHRAHNILVL